MGSVSIIRSRYMTQPLKDNAHNQKNKMWRGQRIKELVNEKKHKRNKIWNEIVIDPSYPDT